MKNKINLANIQTFLMCRNKSNHFLFSHNANKVVMTLKKSISQTPTFLLHYEIVKKMDTFTPLIMKRFRSAA